MEFPIDIEFRRVSSRARICASILKHLCATTYFTQKSFISCQIVNTLKIQES